MIEPSRTTSTVLTAALQLPFGARFFRCALQVNPFAYVVRHGKQTDFETEAAYNAAIIAACKANDVEIIGITDHYRIRESITLIEAAHAAGVFAFPGFEAVSKDGVHFLCLFDERDYDKIERYIGECGIYDAVEVSPVGKLDSTQLLALAKHEWKAVCIAAHATSDQGGLLRKLSGQTRINAWKSEDLLACAIPGRLLETPQDLCPILQNKNIDYHRNRPVAIINSSDVNRPEDLENNSSTCRIKMSEVSIEALRQAFLDPQSRILLSSDNQPEARSEILAISWEGGFLNESRVHFNSGLNVLVGGRGTGKSTVIESIRYILGLEPLGEDARKAHEGCIRNVLRAGTKISMLVRTHRPARRCYTIERSVPNQPKVRDESGEVLDLSPKDVMPGVDIFGQHEIAELTKSREKLTLLLERFVTRDPSASSRKRELQLSLERSRRAILDGSRDLVAIEERLALLPALEETLNRFRDAGLEERLKEKSDLVREERILEGIMDRLAPLHTLGGELADLAAIDSAFLSSKALEGLPNADLLSQAESQLLRLSGKLVELHTSYVILLREAESSIAGVKSGWLERRDIIEATYERILRELQKSNVDGSEFIRLRQQIEGLRPLREKRDQLLRNLDSHKVQRRKLLGEWEDARASDYRDLQQAAKRVSRLLKARVRVNVTMSGNRQPLEQLLRDEVGGNLKAALEKLRELEPFSPTDLSSTCRVGKDALTHRYGIPAGAAERLAGADAELLMRIEEIELPATTDIELNTAADGADHNWQSLDSLSTGQKATAVLLLLLLESNAPLIVDQPEDDLDNRFITEGIVPIMRREKHRRQFVFSTHNANIPVLCDAELIAGLMADGEGDAGQARISSSMMGSMDVEPVRKMVEEILEGGRDAFETRRLKYGF